MTQKTRPRRERGVGGDMEARREYQRCYYQTHKEKAKEYRRQYNLTHKKKARPPGRPRGEKVFEMPRPVVTDTFSRASLGRLQTEQFARMVNKVLRGERLLTP